MMLGEAVLAAVDDEEAAPDPRVDVATDDLAFGRREQEPLGVCWIEPGLEHAFGRRVHLAHQ